MSKQLHLHSFYGYCSNAIQPSKKLRAWQAGILLTLLISVSGCSNTKHLPPGDTLFRGSKIKIVDHEASKKERKVLKADLAGIVRPRTNTKTLGWRFKLSLYNLAGGDTGKKRGLKQWLRNKVGEPPVVGSSVKLETNDKLMINLLQNRGFFQAQASATWDTFRSKKNYGSV